MAQVWKEVLRTSGYSELKAERVWDIRGSWDSEVLKQYVYSFDRLFMFLVIAEVKGLSETLSSLCIDLFHLTSLKKPFVVGLWERGFEGTEEWAASMPLTSWAGLQSHVWWDYKMHVLWASGSTYKHSDLWGCLCPATWKQPTRLLWVLQQKNIAVMVRDVAWNTCVRDTFQYRAVLLKGSSLFSM